MADLEFLSPTDKPALLAITTPELLEQAKTALAELDYKMHVITAHSEFAQRFTQLQYQILIIEETFAGSTLKDNLTLQAIQVMPMAQRRHAFVALISDTFQSLHAMQAYNQSVHVVINRADVAKLKPILQQSVIENNLFLNVYRDTMARLAQGK